MITNEQWINVKDEPIPFNEEILVYLEKPSLGRRIHSAIYRKNGSLIGHHFSYDCPKVTHWMKAPKPPISKERTE